jgi:cytidyltransferase-like protein
VNKIALFSGRFDPIHLGHIITIGRLLEKYQQVIVCVLNYPEREACTIDKNIEILTEFMSLWLYKGFRVLITANTTHFARITIDAIDSICKGVDCDVNDVCWVGGNTEVVDHLKDIGFPFEYIERSYFYRSTTIRELLAKGKDIKEILKYE